VKSLFDLSNENTYFKRNELSNEMPIKAEFKVLSSYISYNNSNDIFEITVPSYDERKLPGFKIRLFQKKEFDCLPERVFFYLTGNSKLVVRP
jgi:hypothetical protein